MKNKNKGNIWTSLETGQKRLALIAGILLVIAGIFGSVETLRNTILNIFNPNHNKGKLEITDVILHSLGKGKYELDFRVENKGNSIISISKVILLCKGITGTMSGIDVSSENEIPLDISSLDKGKKIEGDLAIQVKSNEIDRFKVVLSCSWTDGGKKMWLKPQLKTNNGLVDYKEAIGLKLTEWSDVELSLSNAIENGNIPIVQSILKDDTSFTNIIKEFELVDEVCGTNKKDMLMVLLKKLIPKNQKLFEKGLLTAIDLNKPEIVKALLENRISANVTYKVTPKSWKAVAKDIINKEFPFEEDTIKPYVYNNMISGKITSIEDDSIGVSALQMASYHKNQRIIDLLLAYGANKDFKDKDGKKATDYLNELTK